MLQPYPHQSEAISVGAQRNLLCADKCGLGKTLIGIETARIVQKDHPHPILVVCTKGARLQWEYAIREQLSNALSNTATHILDRVSDYDFVGEGTDSTDWFIIHYAALRKLVKDDLLARTYFSTIILDEAHRIKNRRAQQTRGVKKLVSYRKVCLTATPIEKAPDELWSLLNFLYRDRFRGYYGFKARFVEIEKHPWFGYEQVIGPKNVEELARLLSGIFIQRTKEEVREDMPPLTSSRIPVDTNPRLLRAYNEVKTAGDILVEVTGLDDELLILNAMAKITKLRQLLSNGLGTFTSEKQEYVVDYITNNPDESVIIFTAFRKTAKELAGRLSVPCIIGQHSNIDIQQQKPQVLVGTIRKLGESHDLPWIDTAIFVDSEWSTVLMEQARDRIHRINIISPKQALFLYHPGTVDELVFSALDEKWANLEIVQEYIRRYA